MASDDAYADRKRLTFEQAEGFEPLPAQLRLKEISKELSALLWAIVYHSTRVGLEQYILAPNWTTILFDYHVTRRYKAADEYYNDTRLLDPLLKSTLLSEDYIRVFGFLQFVLRHRSRPLGLAEKLDAVLVATRAAYRILDGNTIIPIGSDAELKTLERAFADLDASEFRGARAHLREAGAALTAANYSASIRESIHAVARTLGPENELRKSLARLERVTAIHGSLREGFVKIYGYTSDEQGIRHPLLDAQAARVDETDALFMIGACAAFVSYLISKARSAGLLNEKKTR